MGSALGIEAKHNSHGTEGEGMEMGNKETQMCKRGEMHQVLVLCPVPLPLPT